ncbi:VOC family protein [Nitrospirillum bahiense]|uniref:Catechol 2,3-dioxygenase-like lactoylglutathione lyase family enzyme n=1 Tax=Nitrospirillum amazonense TaxID=28077 RepID=A0A560G9P9_9PROT|nr:VOC family protein [Nitrospirillum amazonense]TWB30622.1 catechol 2,3-dioxygenase-like lactoylglutathione lyase family enzyme [Nitrospirillum amazonense]
MKGPIIGALVLAGLCGMAQAASPGGAGGARPPIVAVSHLAIYAADMAKSEAFYVHDLGATKLPDPENPAGARYYFSPTQFVEVLPLPVGYTGINRLAHGAFNTPDVAAMRDYLIAKKIAVPGKVQQGSDGSRWFDVTDPEGTVMQFVQAPATPPSIPVNALSSHMMHFGFIVHNRALEDGFYQQILGLHPYWAGGMEDDKPTWISLQLPDGRDWIEYMVVGTPDTKGIPPDLSQATLGVFNHFALAIPNAEAAYTLLWNGDRLKGQDNLPKIGRDAKWQMNLIDPDGTRAELMELHAIGTPCCTPFGAPDPEK